MDRFIRRRTHKANLAQFFCAPAKCRVVGDFDWLVEKQSQRVLKAFGLPQRKFVDHANRQASFNRQICVLELTCTFAPFCGMPTGD